VECERVKGELQSLREDARSARSLAERASCEKKQIFETMQAEIELLRNQIVELDSVY
jgi:hypothetical protein